MIQDFLLVYSPNFDVVSEDGKYQVVTRSYDEANDLLLLNPKKRFPEGTKVLYLSGERKKNALNTIRQWKYQRKRNMKLQW